MTVTNLVFLCSYELDEGHLFPDLLDCQSLHHVSHLHTVTETSVTNLVARHSPTNPGISLSVVSSKYAVGAVDNYQQPEVNYLPRFSPHWISLEY